MHEKRIVVAILCILLFASFSAVFASLTDAAYAQAPQTITPTITLTSSPCDLDTAPSPCLVASSTSIKFEITFNSAIDRSTFETEDVVWVGSNDKGNMNDENDKFAYGIIVNQNEEQTVTLRIPAGSVSDTFGNTNSAAEITIRVDFRHPTVQIPGHKVPDGAYRQFVQIKQPYIAPEVTCIDEVYENGVPSRTDNYDAVADKVVTTDIEPEDLPRIITVRYSCHDAAQREGREYLKVHLVEDLAVFNMPPTVTSIDRFNPSAEDTDSQSLIYRVLFSKEVTGVDTRDFVLSPDSTGGRENNPDGTPDPFMQTRSPSLAIPNLQTVSDTITVPASINAMSVSVAVKISHAYPVDLKVDLIAPDGTVKILHNRSGSGTINIDRTYNPSFANVPATGVWTLRINDNVQSDSGILNSWTLTINYGPPFIPTIAYVAGHSNAYYVTVPAITDGTYNLDLVSSGHGIIDIINNTLSSTVPTTGRDQTYNVSTTVVDSTAPTLASIQRHSPASQDTNSQTLMYEVTFSEDVTGVGADDFVLSNDSTGSTTTTDPVTGISGSGSVYYATVSASTSGTYNLDLVSSGHGIEDTAENPLTDTAPTTGRDQTYNVSITVVDSTAPTLASIERSNPASQDTNSQTLMYEVTFSEDVTGVGADDFVLSTDSTGGEENNNIASSEQFTQTRSPSLAILNLQTVSDAITVTDSGTVTSVSVAVNISHTYIGDLKVDLIAPDGTVRTLHNRSGGNADDIVKTYTPNLDDIQVQGAWKLRINDDASGDVGTLNSWTLTINYGTTTTTTVSPVTGISGSGDTYYVTVSASTDGTYNLDLVSSGHGIEDTAENPLTNTAPTTGTDQTYNVSTTVVDSTAPTLASIQRHSPASQDTNSQTLRYEVTFSEDVTGVGADDFVLSNDSTGGGGSNNNTASSEQFTQTRSPSLAIPNLQTVSDTITVPDSGNAVSVSVAVDISHTYIEDLKVDLIAPDGTVKILHNRSGGSDHDIVKTYAPSFDNVSIAGTWTLRINDNFDADTGTLNSWTLTVNHGTVTITPTTVSPVTGISGSGDTYYVTVSASTDGTYNLDLVSSGHGIEDTAENPLTDTAPTTGRDQTYNVSTTVVDSTAPTLASIQRHSPASQDTNSQALMYEVTFSEDVTGVGTDDFVLSNDSTGSTTTTDPVTGISGSGSVYYATVSASTNGTYNLDLVSSGHGIEDTAENPLTNTAPTTGRDQTYNVSITVVDSTAPTLASIERSNPASQDTSSQTLMYEVTFSEDVTGVGADDFVLSTDSTGGEENNNIASSEQFTQTRSPSLAILNLQTVSDAITVTDSGTVTSVSVAVNISHTYIGDLKVDLIAPDGTVKILHNRSGGNADDIVKTYTPNLDDIQVQGAWKLRINDDASGDVGTLNSWTLTINYGTTTTTTVSPVTGISGSGDTYYVTVSASTDGTYNLDLVSSGHGIEDTAENPLTNTAPTTGTDQTYNVSTTVVDSTAPTLASIERSNPASQDTNSQTLRYEVTFSEDVTGVGADDFVLSNDSTGGGGSNNNTASSEQFTQTRSPSLAIPNLQTVSDTITVPDSGNAVSVSVAVDISHTYIEDLKVDLIAPDGTVKILHNRSGGSDHDIVKTYAPSFDNVSIAGTWTLRINDNFDADTGTLNSWTLTVNHGTVTITPTTVSPVTGISGSGDTYYVTVSASTDGTYNLDLVSSGHGIEDTAENPLTNTAPTTGTDQTYNVSTTVVDSTAPTLASIERSNPASQDTNSQTLRYEVTFSEDVTGVGADDFVLSNDSTGGGGSNNNTASSEQFTQTRSPSLAIPNLQTVSDTITVPDSGNAVSVSVAVDISHTYIEDLKVDLIAPDGTVKILHNRSGGSDHDIVKTYAPSFDNVSIAGTWTLRINDNFDADTGTLNSWTLTVNHGTVTITPTTVSPVTGISGSGDTYYVTVSASTDGTYNLDLVSSGHGIEDAAENPLTDTAPTTGRDQTYNVSTTVVDSTAPTLASIQRHSPASQDTNSQALMYEVTFSEDVTGVGTDDFVLSNDSTGSTTTTDPVTGISGSGSVYYATVSASTSGTYNLDLVSSGHGIEDTAENPLTNTAPTTGRDQTYNVSITVVDSTAPTLASIERSNPASQDTNSQTLMYEVTFSEDVTGVGADDFVLSTDSTGGEENNNIASSEQFTQTRSPSLAILNLQTVSDAITVTDSGTVTSVSVAVNISHTYIGDLKVDLIAPDGTVKILHNRSGGNADDIVKTYTPNLDGKQVQGAWKLRINDDASGDVGTLNSWTLTINYGTTTTTTVSPVTGISGSGDTYYVTVSASTDGTYNLDLVSSGHGIEDTAENPLTNTAPTTGTDQTYNVSTTVVDSTAPTLASIERSNPASQDTNSQTLRYEVTFSEDVTGVGADDFVLSNDSTGGGGSNNNTASSEQFTQTRSPSLAIPNLQTVSDTITVPDSGNAVSVSVAVDISHTYIEDLKVDLIAPDGTVKILHNRSGGSDHDIVKTYAPSFDNVSIAGTWTLRINDNFDADTGTLNSWTLTVNHGTVTITPTTVSPVTGISGSGDTYYVTVSASTDGTYNLDLVSSGHGIEDTAENPLTDTAPTTGTDQTYNVSTTVVDSTAPTLASIQRHSPASQDTNSQALMYEVTFSEDVTGVGTDDFVLSNDSTGSTTTTDPVTGISGSGSVYYATVSASTSGTYNLDLVSSGHGIEDAAENPLTDTAPTTGTDQTYNVSITVVDSTAPTLASIERSNPASQDTNSQTLMYEVTFSEDVTGVGADDFVLSNDSTGGGSNTTTTVSGQFTQTHSPSFPIIDNYDTSDTITVQDSGTVTSVSVAVNISHTYIGDLKVDLIAPDGTVRTLHDRSGGNTDNIVKTYTPNLDNIQAQGAWKLRINDDESGDVGTLNSWTLAISYETVTTTPQVSPVTGISGSGDTYYVTVSASTDGTYNLDLVSSGHGIEDEAGNSLINATPTTGTDQTYTVSTDT